MIFDREMLIRLSDRALTLSRIAARRTPTIANSMKLEFRKDPSGVHINVEIPFFWAKWYVYGRKAIQAKPGKVLVWFEPRSADPRIRGGYPARRRSDVRRLTKEEFYYHLNRGEIHKAERVGPWAGNNFIPHIYAAWAPWAEEVLKEATKQELHRIFRPLRRIKKVDLPVPLL